MLYYAIPILSIVLPPEYVHHLSLLVTSLHLLLSDSLSISDLDMVHNMLSTFYKMAGELYSPNIYTANTHSLQHLVPLVRLWGPLWCYSMFGFENLNGYLGSMFHGTCKIVYQISFQLQLLQMVPFKLRELSKSETPHTQEYLKTILDKKRSTMTKIDDHCYAIGKISSCVLQPDEVNAINTTTELNLTNSKVEGFERVLLNNIVFHSKRYTRSTIRNNKMCSYVAVDGSLKFGCIQSFYLSHQCSPFCIILVYNVTNSSPTTNLRPPRNIKFF